MTMARLLIIDMRLADNLPTCQAWVFALPHPAHAIPHLQVNGSRGDLWTFERKVQVEKVTARRTACLPARLPA